MDQMEYRRGVGMVVINDEKKKLKEQKLEKDKPSWQSQKEGIRRKAAPWNAQVRGLGFD